MAAAEVAVASAVEKLYEYGDILQRADDKSKHEAEYLGIIAGAKGDNKAKQLSAQLIPKYLKFYEGLSSEAINAQLDLCEEEEVGVRVQAIRGLPMLCKDTPQHLEKIADVLGQLLLAEDKMEQDSVKKALMTVLRQDVKRTLQALFAHIEKGEENVRERVLQFVKDKVFPAKTELLKPEEEMERFVTDLIKKSLEDVTGAEFKMFMDFLMSLNMFGKGAAKENVQELLDVVEKQADLASPFSPADSDSIDKLLDCLQASIPMYSKGASNSKFVNYVNKQVIPQLEKVAADKKTSLMKALAETAPFTSAQDCRTMLPSVVGLLKKEMPSKKTTDELNFSHIECLLYTFHKLASKTPNTTNALCGFKIVTGQPSDRLGEDFSEMNKDITERLTVVEDMAKAKNKKVTQEVAEHKQALTAAKEEPAKVELKAKIATEAALLKTCNNVLTLAKPLHNKAPSFFGDGHSFTLSWKESMKPASGQQGQGGNAGGGAKRTGAGVNGTVTSPNAGKRPKTTVGGPAGQARQAGNGAAMGGGRGRGRGGRGVWRGRGGRGFW
eukprot:TRINITY_DN513_c0_g1_i1.p1 TRINITY_DN513_c0_g1~~TRINITY_DN513_c0_g1_i1.p1  ORF type:complete len:554 (+),score=150.28 TRINITY_DN513_c0_g1_i1:552-2213(+)